MVKRLTAVCGILVVSCTVVGTDVAGSDDASERLSAILEWYL